MSYVLLFKDQEKGTSRQIPLEGAIFRIGKSPDNDLPLEQSAISRRHCQLEEREGKVVVFDLGSRNGTYLDGKRLPPESGVVFSPGQTLQMGTYSLELQPDLRNPKRPPVEHGAVRMPEPERAVSPAPPPAAEKPKRRVTPVELKRVVHATLIDRMDLKHTDMSKQTDAELRLRTEQVCAQIVQEYSSKLPPWLTAAALVREVVNEAVGLGLLEELLEDEDVDEIMVCGWDKIYVERRGRLELTNMQFTDNAQVVAIIRRILAPIGRRIDETSPLADGRLADGSRVNAIISPLALSGPTLTIRKFAKTPFTVDDLVDRFHSFTHPMADFLQLAVKHRANILISGGTGSGKTTLLNVTSNFIPDGERIVTVEDAAELQLQQDHVVRLESRPPNIEGRNAVPIRDLVKNCLRMRPDRIVVGECRGGEALDMLQAMNTGHDGSLTTLHANSPRDALARLETLVLMAGMELPSRAIREQINSAINFIVQISRMPDGSRKLTHITGISGMEGDIITLQDIFVYKQEGFDSEGKVVGKHLATGSIPDFVQELRQRGIAVDMGMFGE
jgi:pilus assembly protein CpaF